MVVVMLIYAICHTYNMSKFTELYTKKSILIYNFKKKIYITNFNI